MESLFWQLHKEKLIVIKQTLILGAKISILWRFLAFKWRFRGVLYIRKLISLISTYYLYLMKALGAFETHKKKTFREYGGSVWLTFYGAIRGEYWSVLTNMRRVLISIDQYEASIDQYWPIWGQYWSVLTNMRPVLISIDQWEAVLTNERQVLPWWLTSEWPAHTLHSWWTSPAPARPRPPPPCSSSSPWRCSWDPPRSDHPPQCPQCPDDQWEASVKSIDQ